MFKLALEELMKKFKKSGGVWRWTSFACSSPPAVFTGSPVPSLTGHFPVLSSGLS